MFANNMCVSVVVITCFGFVYIGGVVALQTLQFHQTVPTKLCLRIKLPIFLHFLVVLGLALFAWSIEHKVGYFSRRAFSRCYEYLLLDAFWSSLVEIKVLK